MQIQQRIKELSTTGHGDSQELGKQFRERVKNPVLKRKDLLKYNGINLIIFMEGSFLKYERSVALSQKLLRWRSLQKYVTEQMIVRNRYGDQIDFDKLYSE